MMKAMKRTDKRCLSLKLEQNTKDAAEAKDMRAKQEIESLAKALAHASKSCGKGATNPAPGTRSTERPRDSAARFTAWQ